MRVNHAGEIAAQGLYQGQALTARQPETEAALRPRPRPKKATTLAWCRDRLDELGSASFPAEPAVVRRDPSPSGRSPAFFGDRASLGFMAETERQVEGHLADHLGSPARRMISAAAPIVEQMQVDEIGHGRAAIAAGASTLPEPVPSSCVSPHGS